MILASVALLAGVHVTWTVHRRARSINDREQLRVRGVELAKIADDPKVLKAVLKRPSWQSIGDATAAVLEQRKRDDAAEERRKQLRAAGIQHVVKYPENGYSRWAPAKDVPLDWLEEDGVDVAEHEHFACHGVAVGYSRYGSELRVVPICTNAKAHPESKTAKAAVGRDKQAAAVERDAAATLRRKQARLDLLAGLCGKTVDPTAEAIAYLHLADDVFEYFYDDDARDLCAVLGVTIPDEPPAGPDNRAEDALRTFIDAADDKTVRRFVVAAQLLLLDNQRSRGPIDGRYLAMLGGRGYKLDKDERATVAKLEAPVAS